MPDWSYHTIFKPLITRLPSSIGREFIHRGMNLIASLPGGAKFIEFLGQSSPSLEIHKELWDISFSSPIGLSGKIDPFLSGTKAFSNLGFGFIEIGPITQLPQTSHSARFSHIGNDIVFPHRIESIGSDDTLKRLHKLNQIKTPLFLRFSHELTHEQLKSILPAYSLFASAIVLESCFDCDDMRSLKGIIGNKQPFFLAIQPDNVSHFQKVKDCIDGIIIEEKAVTRGNEQRIEPNQKKEIIGCISFLRKIGIPKIPIIVSGGVLEPQDALDLIFEGADLIMLSGGYVLSGPGLPKRINEALIEEHSPPNKKFEGWIWYWLFGLAIVIGGLIALIFSLTSVILPYDEAFLGFTREEIMAINPNLIYFMAHDRMTVAGTMVSGGILYMKLARHGVKKRFGWPRKTINLAGFVGFLGIFLFIGFGYFDWLHAIFWIILLPLFLCGFLKNLKANRHPVSINRTNHSAWKKSLWGQLCFIILGFSFVIGGVVISLIGVTNVFVPSDVTFICMSPEQMNELTNSLIPLIAHDRAGFGSSLLSVGLLILIIVLCGFHQGQKWIWNTLLIGGIPAFSAGILTHFVIGYTTFLHLLPAYFALFLYITGLILSKSFFYMNVKR